MNHMEDIQTQTEIKDKLLFKSICGMWKILFARWMELFNTYKISDLFSLDSIEKPAQNYK